MRGSLFTAVVVASLGPLGFVALYLPSAGPAPGLTVILALLVFLAPLAVWLGFSERIASAGGLTAFVEAYLGFPDIVDKLRGTT